MAGNEEIILKIKHLYLICWSVLLALLAIGTSPTEVVHAAPNVTHPADDPPYPPDWPVVATDTFDSNDNDWMVGPDSNEWRSGDWKIENGKLRWEITALQPDILYYQYPDLPIFSDFYVSVDFQIVSGDENADGGLLFRHTYNDTLSSYTYYIYPVYLKTSQFTSYRYDNGNWVRLFDFQDSPVINQNGPNKLAVLAIGSSLKYYINDQLVYETQDDHYKKGQIGFVVEMHEEDIKTVFEFDNLEIRAPLGPENYIKDGEALLAQGDPTGAGEKFQLAIDYYKNINDEPGKAVTYNSIGQIYLNAKYFDQAEENLLKALEIRQENPVKSEMVETLELLASLYSSKADFRNEIKYYSQYLEVLHIVIDDRAYAETLHRIGIAYINLSDYEQALAYTQQALDMRMQWTEFNDKINVSRGYNNLGVIYFFLGDSAQGLSYYEKALEMNREINDYSIRTAIYNSNIGGVYYDQKDYEKALDYYLQALQIYDDPNVLHRNKDFYNSENLLGIGTVYSDLKNFEQAFSFLEQAKTIIDRLQNPIAEADALASFGEVHQKQGTFEEALTYYQQALAIYEKIGNKSNVQRMLDFIGQIDEELGKDNDALTSYLESINTLESILTGLKSETNKSSFSGSGSDVYQRAVRLLFEAGRTSEAFSLSERNRARVFLDSMGNKRPDLQHSADKFLLQDEELLRNEINSLDQQLLDEKNKSGQEINASMVEVISSQLLEKQQAYKELLARIQASDPEMASLVTVPVTTIEDVQALLNDQTTLVSYYFTDTTALATVISKDQVQEVILPATPDQINEAVNNYRNLGMSNLENLTPRSLISLYEWLIVPIKENITTPYLGIIPHQALHYLPFAALTDGEHFLGEEYSLYYLPSASTLQFIQGKIGRPSSVALVLGNPQTQNPDLAPLNFASQEAEMVAGMFSSEAEIGANASEDILASQSGMAGILHLAVHGSFNPAAPLFSRLWLAPTGTNDGRLNVYEIYGLDLHSTNLVILSACQTQLGDISAGDEIVGLTRAFLYGAPSVVASLWSVDDEATGFLIESFYKNLLAGESKASALQIAQEAVRTNPDHPEWKHPYYWAAFVLNGDPGTLTGLEARSSQKAGDPTSMLLMIGMAAVGVWMLIAVFFLLRRRRSSSVR